MIVDPLRSPEEIDRRLSALEDETLAQLLRAANRDLYSFEELDTARAPSVPYWKRRVGLLTLAGLIALVTGYASVSSVSRERAHAIAPPPVTATERHVVKPPQKPLRHTAIVRHAVAVSHPPSAKAEHVAIAPAPAVISVQQVRSQLAHERALAAQAQADAARSAHQAQVASKAQQQAQAQELQQALAQARAQARAQTVAQMQARAAQQAADAAWQDRQQQYGTKPLAAPPDYGRIPSDGSGNVPPPLPPGGGSCTPNRAVFLTSMLTHVRVGGTSAGALLHLIHH